MGLLSMNRKEGRAMKQVSDINYNCIALFETEEEIRDFQKRALFKTGMTVVGLTTGGAMLGGAAGVAAVAAGAGGVAGASLLIAETTAAGAAAGSIVPGPGTVAGGAVGALSGAVIVTAGFLGGRHLWKTRKAAQHKIDAAVTFEWAEERGVVFPAGPPRSGVVYRLHPLRNSHYFPIANFHRDLLQEQFGEALTLLRDTGACDIKLTVVEGFSSALFADLAASALGGLAGSVRQSDATSYSVVENLPGSKKPKRDPAEFPDEFVWYRVKPALKQAYAARAHGDVKQQTVTQVYSDDFGVNAGLNAMVDKIGLSAGGTFVDFAHTSWVWDVTYP
jgi:hypothetical protein